MSARTPLLRASRNSQSGRVLALLCACVAAVLGCSESLPEAPADLPDEKLFPLVLDAVERRCATLDCHGSPGRNLRLYTGSGLRLASEDVPGNGSTTAEEYAASYWAVVGLEPEIMSAVVADEGAHPERLTLIRKARGTEGHEPGAVIEEGDATDECITSWLAGKTSESACKKAASYDAPGT